MINIKRKSQILQVSSKWKTDFFSSERQFRDFPKHYEPQKKNEKNTSVCQSLFILSFPIL